MEYLMDFDSISLFSLDLHLLDFSIIWVALIYALLYYCFPDSALNLVLQTPWIISLLTSSSLAIIPLHRGLIPLGWIIEHWYLVFFLSAILFATISMYCGFIPVERIVEHGYLIFLFTVALLAIISIYRGILPVEWVVNHGYLVFLSLFAHLFWFSDDRTLAFKLLWTDFKWTIILILTCTFLALGPLRPPHRLRQKIKWTIDYGFIGFFFFFFASPYMSSYLSSDGGEFWPPLTSWIGLAFTIAIGRPFRSPCLTGAIHINDMLVTPTRTYVWEISTNIAVAIWTICTNVAGVIMEFFVETMDPPAAVQNTANNSANAGNPVQLDHQDLVAALREMHTNMPPERRRERITELSFELGLFQAENGPSTFAWPWPPQEMPLP